MLICLLRRVVYNYENVNRMSFVLIEQLVYIAQIYVYKIPTGSACGTLVLLLLVLHYTSAMGMDLNLVYMI